jgi:hypothetical protein
MVNLRRRFAPMIVLAATAAASLWVPESSVAAGAGHASPVCSRHEVVQRVRTDQGRYAPGQPVKITLAATNVSDHDCAAPSTASLRIRSASGRTVWHSAVAVDWVGGARWRSGRSVTWNFTWDQQTCTSTDCPGTASPGTYVAVAGWESYPPDKARFVINGIK